MNRDRTFQDAVTRFEGVKAKFSEFCAVCSGCFNDNEYFPGVAFKASDDGAALLAFDRTFEISCAPMPDSVGVLSVALVEADERVPLVRWYFDRSGNVNEELDAPWGYDPLTDKNFALGFVNAIAKAYMARVAAGADRP